MSNFPKEPVHDAELAGEYARKFFGKMGFAKVEEINGGFNLYQVGVVSPGGEWIEKGGSYHDFAEAFATAKYYISVRDPLYMRWQMKQEAQKIEAKEPELEQIGFSFA